MREMPILFKGDMVLAILDGRKTMTRRLRGLDVINANPDRWRLWHGEIDGVWAFADHPTQGEKGSVIEVRCPYGVLGDRLWVRETFESKNVGDKVPIYKITYCADGKSVLRVPSEAGRPKNGKHPSIHMPRGASRITLEIMGVRVEHVQDIPNSDTVAEGIEPPIPAHIDNGWCTSHFAKLWDSINVKRGYGWRVNPWVWVVSFKDAR